MSAWRRTGARETGRAVEREVHGHARLAQAERDRPGHLLVVLDHEHPHRHSAFPAPAFKAAVRACESLIPGGVHGGSGSSSRAAP
jgi:hypothetical protein